MFVFLDDERKPPATGRFAKSKIIRSYGAFTSLIDRLDNIDGVSFDHDLSDEKTGMDCAHYLINSDLTRDIIPRTFVLAVHSMNPVGARNIEMLMANYFKTKWPDFF